jgi:hypothetical protein
MGVGSDVKKSWPPTDGVMILNGEESVSQPILDKPVYILCTVYQNCYSKSRLCGVAKHLEKNPFSMATRQVVILTIVAVYLIILSEMKREPENEIYIFWKWDDQFYHIYYH